jgi:hypothetical protein
VRLQDVFAAPRSRFALAAAAALVPLLILWWLGSGLIINLLRPGADWLAGQLGLARSINSLPSHDWQVDTGLERASGTDIGGVVLRLDAVELRRVLLSFPLFLAFILAPPRFKPIRSIAIGCAVLIVLFWVSACSLIFNSLAVIINHRASMIMDNAPPPPFTVTHRPLNDLSFFLSGLGMYLALQVLPLVVPVGLWAGLNPVGRRALLAPNTSKVEVEDALE